jgi:nicotinamidase-related amidase
MNLASILVPEDTVVIVIDKQNAYLNNDFVGLRRFELSDNSEEILGAVDGFIEQTRQKNVEVIWTQMVEDTELSPANIALKMTSDNCKTISNPDNESYNFYGRTAPADAEKVFTKYFYNAFADGSLADYLEKSDKKTVVLIGGYASRCVLATAFGANSCNLQVVIPKGLIVNQKHAENEVPVVYDICDAILGYTANPEQILNYW